MKQITITQFDDLKPHVSTTGDRDELVQLIAMLILEDQLFFDAYLIAEILHSQENSNN